MLETEAGHCETCNQPCSQKCSKCKTVYYCSTEHQEENWKNHKENCNVYEIDCSNESGTLVVAKRDLEPGEVILEDTSIVFGPSVKKINKGHFPCVSCNRFIPKVLFQCPHCFWPLCNLECPYLEMHEEECKVLRIRGENKKKESPYEFYRYDILVIIRALLLQKSDPKKWNIIINMKDYLSDRRPNTEIFKIIQEKAEFIQEKYLKPFKDLENELGESILPEISNGLIHKLYGIFAANAINIEKRTKNLVVLYPSARLIEHSCIPNVSQDIHEKDFFKIKLRAALPITKGEHITMSYCEILQGTQERKEYLKAKHISCNCKRCRDPTELGTFLSALICMGTQRDPCYGIQLPLKPLTDEPKWLCNKCGIKLPNSEVLRFVHHLTKQVNKEMHKSKEELDRDELKSFCAKLETFLHPHHFLVHKIKYLLVQHDKEGEEVEAPVEFLNEKVLVCQGLIDVTRRIDPGSARLKLHLATLLSEQFKAKTELLERCFIVDNKEASLDLARETLEILTEIQKILEFGKRDSAGQKLHSEVQKCEANFKHWLQENLTEILN